MAGSKRTGPRGGRTTRNETGAMRKTYWLDEDVVEALRRRAFEERRTEKSIVHEALRRYLGLAD